MYLLDTCVFSEFAKPIPNVSCMKWASSVPEADIFLSTLVLGELLRGVERMDTGARRDGLHVWLEGLFSTHRARLVPVDPDVVRVRAKICAEAEDFRQQCVKILDPWE